MNDLLSAVVPIAMISVQLFIVVVIPLWILWALWTRRKTTVVYLRDPGAPCPSCGTPTVAAARFCHHCGARLEG